jgi:circadian clock protein KaiB
MATPTLLKEQPPPERMAVGDLSDSKRVLLALDLPVHE